MDTTIKKNEAISSQCRCRVCLCEESNESVSLYTIHEGDFVFHHINAIANVDIQESDNLPDKICSHCFAELKTAISFKRKCHNSNKLLRDSSHGTIKDDSFVIHNNIKNEPDDVVFFDGACEFNDIVTFEGDIKGEDDLKEEDIKEDDSVIEDDVKAEENGVREEISLIDNNVKGDLIFDVLKEENKRQEVISNIQSSLLRPSRAIDLKLECNECGNLFKSKCKIAVHWKKVHFPETLICSVCKHAFKTFKALKNHEKLSKKCKAVLSGLFYVDGVGRSRIFKCKECSYKSKSLASMICHIRTHTGEKPFKCSLCELCFAQRSSLDGHKERVHKLFNFEMTCQFCGKYYTARNAARRHIQRHKQKEIECSICKKKIRGKTSLALHMLRHAGVKNFSCDKCTSIFYTKAELCTHILKVHNPYGKYKKFECSHCTFKPGTRELLIIHESKHIMGLISCTICGKFLASQEKLMIHQTLNHYSEKNVYSCPICKKKYTNRRSIGSHLTRKHKMYLTSSAIPKPEVKKKKKCIAKSNGNI